MPRQSTKSIVALQAQAEKLCALIFLRDTDARHHAIELAEARKALNILPAELDLVVTWAEQSHWVRRLPHAIALRAAGIYVAKSFLDLSR